VAELVPSVEYQAMEHVMLTGSRFCSVYVWKPVVPNRG